MNELILEYININYSFTCNADGWCILDKSSGENLILVKLIRDLDRIFVGGYVSSIVVEWWDKNTELTTLKIGTHLSKYKIVMVNKPIVWEVQNYFGKAFDIKYIMSILPEHFSRDWIEELYNKWYEEELIKINEDRL